MNGAEPCAHPQPELKPEDSNLLVMSAASSKADDLLSDSAAVNHKPDASISASLSFAALQSTPPMDWPACSGTADHF